MSGEAIALLQNYAVLKRRFTVQLSLLEDLRALAKRAAEILPETAAVLEERAKPLEIRLSEEVLELCEQIGLAENLIRQIQNPLFKEVLERRYMQQAEYKEIAQAMHYSERHIRRLHRAALEQVSDCFLQRESIN